MTPEELLTTNAMLSGEVERSKQALNMPHLGVFLRDLQLR